MDNTIWNKDIFAKNLQKYMVLSGKTQKELAEIIGVAPPTLNEWLKGKKYPRIDKIEKLANYFGILKSDLIEDKGKQELKSAVKEQIIHKLNTDSEFLEATELLYNLDSEQIASVKQLIAAFSPKK